MENVVIPYELPETENHSFFFIDQHIDTNEPQATNTLLAVT